MPQGDTGHCTCTKRIKGFKWKYCSCTALLQYLCSYTLTTKVKAKVFRKCINFATCILCQLNPVCRLSKILDLLARVYYNGNSQTDISPVVGIMILKLHIFDPPIPWHVSNNFQSQIHQIDRNVKVININNYKLLLIERSAWHEL